MFIINHKGQIQQVPEHIKKSHKTYYSYLWEHKFDIKFKKDSKQQNDIQSHISKILKGE